MSLLHRKSVASLIAASEAGHLHRVLGQGQLILLGIGAIIGAGIFVLTGQVASQNAGPGLVISMVMAGVACALAGLCYAELASMIPVAGSAYTYAYATLGELAAWIIGWDLVLEYALSSSTVALGWGATAVSLLADVGIVIPPQFTTAPFNLPAALVVLLITGLLVLGVKESARTNTIIVIVKLAVIAIFIVAGSFFVKPELWHPLVPPNTGTFGEFGWSGVLRGAGVIFFAYIGFDAVSTAAQEARNPQRDIPRGILWSLAICTVLYIAVALVLTGIVDYRKLDVASPISVGIEATGLTWLAPVIKIGALAGLFSVMLVNLMAQPRIFFSMARDGLLPAWAAKVHPRFRTPHVTTLVTGICVAVAAATLPLNVLSQLVSMGTLLAFAIVCGGVLLLRRTDPDLARPFRVPLVPYLPIAGVLACLYLMIGLPLSTWGRLVLWLAAGLSIYFLFGRGNAARLRTAHADPA
jgi:basic amino acid/polyamine antiporter, APA family